MEKILKIKPKNKINFINFVDDNFKKSFQINKNILNVKNNKKFEKLLKNVRKKNYNYIRIEFEKIKGLSSINFFYNFISSSIPINNMLIFYVFGSEIRGSNLFPIWPNSYKKLSFLSSTYIWLKKFLLFFFYFKKIKLILIKLK